MAISCSHPADTLGHENGQQVCLLCKAEARAITAEGKLDTARKALQTLARSYDEPIAIDALKRMGEEPPT